MKPIHASRLITVVVIIAAGAACSSGNPERTNKVRDALDSSQVSLAQSIEVVEKMDVAAPATTTKLVPTRAALVTEADRRFSVVASGADGAAKHIDIDKAGKILAVNPATGSTPVCPGPTSLKDAIVIAEKASGGKAFQIQPDDDDACLYEVQTLAGSTIWEVKIDRSGNVVEKEDATNDSEE